MKKSILQIVFLLIILPSFLSAEETKKSPIEILYSVECFAFGGTGYAAIISKGEIAFKKILKGGTPKESFINIFENANLQGKSYALVAIHSLDIDLYSTLVNEFKNENREVTVMSGCSLYEQKTKEIVNLISSNRFSKYLERITKSK